MSNQNILSVFQLNPLTKYERTNLSYLIFKGLNFKKEPFPISFFRSDFRGSKFENVEFYKNNFDRADFVNSVFQDCIFQKVNFGCCQMKNCLFHNVVFDGNFYKNTSIHSTTFIGCSFPDESFLINMQRCQFIDCTISGCLFEMSTTDTVTFKNCIIKNSNLATMHAEYHTFINCDLTNCFLGTSYFFGYLIANCTMTDILFLYRGYEVPYNELNIKEIYNDYEKNHRFYELINVLIFSKRYNDILNVIKKAFDFYGNPLSKYLRKLEIECIFRAIIFYIKYEKISFEQAYEIVDYFKDKSWDEFPADEKLEYACLTDELANCLFTSDFSSEYINNISKEMTSIFTIKFNEDDLNTCLRDAYFIMHKYLQDKMKNVHLISKKKGSWILTFAIPTLLLLTILPKIIREYADVYFDISLKRNVNKKAIKLINNENTSLPEFNQLVTTLSKNEVLTKDEIPAEKILSAIESMSVKL